MTKFKLSLHLFRKDLRLDDNTALQEALETSAAVIPCFILDKKQVMKNPYKSENSIEFMINSLKDLENELQKKGGRLYIFYGYTETIIQELLSKNPIQAIFFNNDYTPFSIERDKKIRSICKQNKIHCMSYDDTLINAPGKIMKKNGTPYTMFTPFLKQARTFSVDKPIANTYNNYYIKKLETEIGQKIYDQILKQRNINLPTKGGLTEGKTLLSQIKYLKNYDIDRNLPAKNKTSFLSAHIKFGTISIREVFWSIHKELGLKTSLTTELYWRDFFYNIIYHFPAVLGSAFHKKYNQIEWSNNHIKFNAWCSGKTGYPIVDAGMRQLNTTGWMHNRVRMITASFLVKDIQIDWRWGEKYFAQHLVDYDPAVNNGNWQWAASTGCDAQPYFRIFNPWRQHKKFDPDCEYVKKWIPELKKLTPKEIFLLENERNTRINYPAPIVNHKLASGKTVNLFKSLRYKNQSL